jgi:hypothetical protein
MGYIVILMSFTAISPSIGYGLDDLSASSNVKTANEVYYVCNEFPV